MIGNPLPELMISILILIVNNQQFVPHKLVPLPYLRYQSMYNTQKTLHKCSGYKQQCVGGRAFFLVSFLDSRNSGDNTSEIFTHHCSQFIGKWWWSIDDPPTKEGALLTLFSKLGQGMIDFYQFCAVGKI